jgi:hypothetical protein
MTIAELVTFANLRLENVTNSTLRLISAVMLCPYIPSLASMPSFFCKCGERILDGQIPQPNEWLLMSDVEYGTYSGMIDAEQLYLAMKSMLLCPQCGRVWIFWNDYQQPPTCYSPE